MFNSRHTLHNYRTCCNISADMNIGLDISVVLANGHEHPIPIVQINDKFKLYLVIINRIKHSLPNP